MGAGTRAQVDSGLELCWGSLFAAAACVLRALSPGRLYVVGEVGICVASNGEDPHSLEQCRWDRRKMFGRQHCREKRDFRDQAERELGERRKLGRYRTSESMNE